MKKLISALTLCISVSLLAACGGGGGTSPMPLATTPVVTPAVVDPAVTPVTPVAATYVATDYSGTWSGVYSLGGTVTRTGVSASIKLTGTSNTSVVAGNIYSQYVTGVLNGQLVNGKVTIPFTNTVDGLEWAIVLSRTTTGLVIESINYGAAITGTGSCTATVLAAGDFDLTGEYPATYQKLTGPAPADPDPKSSQYNARVVLVRVNEYEYNGFIDDGMNVQGIKMLRASNSWFFSGSTGPFDATPDHLSSSAGLLTNHAFIHDDEIKSSLADGAITPLMAPARLPLSGWQYSTIDPSVKVSVWFMLNIYFEGRP